MDRLHAMRVFLEVARDHSFAAAARQLNVSTASVSRTVSALERHIGADLFVRTTRTVRLTEAGERFAPECERILSEIEAAEATAAGTLATPTGTLTVTAPVLFGQLYMVPIITAFCDAHPDVDVQLVLLDRVTNMFDEGIDVALRIGELPDSSLKAKAVGKVRRVVTGANSYFARNGVPQSPSDLKQHRIVAVTSAYSAVEWRFGGPDKSIIRIQPKIRCNNNSAAIGIAEAGWALTRVLSYQVGSALEAGRLRLILEAFEEDALPVHLVYTPHRHVAPKTRAFVDFASNQLQSNPIFS